MVFAINPPRFGPRSFDDFKKRAIAINGTATDHKITGKPSVCYE
jgi:hypothetical protein